LIVSKKTVEREKLSIEDPTPIEAKKVEWFIITPENVEEIFSELNSKNYDLILIGLTDEGYKNLSLNLIELRKFLLQQKAVIKAYRDYYEPEE
jgi:hypothetical protein